MESGTPCARYCVGEENVEAIALGGASGLTVRAFARLDYA
jgi:hypothetical protein